MGSAVLSSGLYSLPMTITPKEHKEWLRTVSQAEIDHMYEEYRSWAGESERDAAVRDTNHVVVLQSTR